jgi:hypothetical protein
MEAAATRSCGSGQGKNGIASGAEPAQNECVLTNSRLTWVLTVTAVAVTALSLALGGMHHAVLNSVRYSGLVFVVALAARAQGSSLHSLQRALTVAFPLAHYVHFAAVALLVYFNLGHPLRNGRGLQIMAGGFTLITVLLFAVVRGTWPKLEAATFYLAGFFLLVAFGGRFMQRPISAVMVVLLVSALVYRIANRHARAMQATTS